MKEANRRFLTAAVARVYFFGQEIKIAMAAAELGLPLDDAGIIQALGTALLQPHIA